MRFSQQEVSKVPVELPLLERTALFALGLNQFCGSPRTVILPSIKQCPQGYKSKFDNSAHRGNDDMETLVHEWVPLLRQSFTSNLSITLRFPRRFHPVHMCLYSLLHC